MNQVLFRVLIVVAALAAASITHAARGWSFLGERVVSYTVDHDVIQVGSYEGFFRKVGFRVKGNDVRFRKVVIHYENGGKQEIDRNFHVEKGARSPVLDLVGKRRKIDRISIWYDTKGFDGRATVRAYGLR